MNLIDKYLERANEIIGDRTPEEEEYDREVLLWLEKTGKIRKAINKANKKYPSEALQYNEENIADIWKHYDYLLNHMKITRKIGN